MEVVLDVEEEEEEAVVVAEEAEAAEVESVDVLVEELAIALDVTLSVRATFVSLSLVCILSPCSFSNRMSLK